ncbi:hypothetical protein MNEG_9881 [Monoraphidium neglectum]|jgi:hypothetical protein|uniref:Uncharacterized protein n=1 Tax=Monoraphidium neglectum TaxID=145388 RepID=A0A0D2MB15_9CHLO|nr:hypothetical protein MNEG_9881 [Monoraphidium neglectum]KIY98081.1 hypothetical protein MNEG_9881 [Monoraphidium neglectum]|eukprot:XP_013897101.1 hypothetical protein MNEG_9881 [Monoraphidium neglectum]
MGVTSGLITLPASIAAASFGFAALPSLPLALVLADKVSLATAAISCSAGLAAETVKARRGAGQIESDGEDGVNGKHST